MTTSKNNVGKSDENFEVEIDETPTGGALADGLTLVRILLTPVIMLLIVTRWPEIGAAAIASMLFAVAAITDIFDDYFGGTENAPFRKLGYLDDIADTVLVVGTLLALSYVLLQNGLFTWVFAVPAVILIARELAVGLIKGFELQRYGWPDNPLSSAKAGFSMLAVCLLVASPWITTFIDSARANEGTLMQVYNNASPMVWIVGMIALWIAAVFSVLSAVKIFKADLGPSNGA